MRIHKVIFAGLIASYSFAHANPAALEPVEPNPIESVANIVKPIGKELVGLTAMPASQVPAEANELGAAMTGPAARAPVVGSASLVRNVNIEVDAPVASAVAGEAPAPIQENDINMFLLLALLVGAILLRRRAE